MSEKPLRANVVTYAGYNNKLPVYCEQCKVTLAQIKSFRSHCDRFHPGETIHLHPEPGREVVAGNRDRDDNDDDAFSNDNEDRSPQLASLLVVAEEEHASQSADEAPGAAKGPFDTDENAVGVGSHHGCDLPVSLLLDVNNVIYEGEALRAILNARIEVPWPEGDAKLIDNRKQTMMDFTEQLRVIYDEYYHAQRRIKEALEREDTRLRRDLEVCYEQIGRLAMINYRAQHLAQKESNANKRPREKVLGDDQEKTKKIKS